MFHGYGSVATHGHTLRTLPASARTSPTPPPPARTCPSPCLSSLLLLLFLLPDENFQCNIK